MYTFLLVLSLAFNVAAAVALFLVWGLVREEKEALADVQKCRDLMQNRGQKFVGASWALQQAFCDADQFAGGMSLLQGQCQQLRADNEAFVVARRDTRAELRAAIENEAKASLALQSLQSRYEDLYAEYQAVCKHQVLTMKELKELQAPEQHEDSLDANDASIVQTCTDTDYDEYEDSDGYDEYEYGDGTSMACGHCGQLHCTCGEDQGVEDSEESAEQGRAAAAVKASQK